MTTHDTLMALCDALTLADCKEHYCLEAGSEKEFDLAIKEKQKARAALSAAINEVLAERDTLAKDAARYRFINGLCSQVGRDSEKIVRLIGNHQHLDALIADEHIANASKMMKGTPT